MTRWPLTRRRENHLMVLGVAIVVPSLFLTVASSHWWLIGEVLGILTMLVAVQSQMERKQLGRLRASVSTTPVTGWVVVTLLSPGECTVFDGRDCVQSVIVAADGQPFRDKQAADAEAATWPDWCCPHTMQFTRSMTKLTKENPDDHVRQ